MNANSATRAEKHYSIISPYPDGLLRLHHCHCTRTARVQKAMNTCRTGGSRAEQQQGGGGSSEANMVLISKELPRVPVQGACAIQFGALKVVAWKLVWKQHASGDTEPCTALDPLREELMNKCSSLAR